MNTYLVTGASGYIASWVVKQLLEQGETVHGTVRSLKDKSKTGHLLEMQKNHPGRLKLFEADLMNRESFREPMEGCNIVIHMASPFFISKIKNASEDLLKPALDGTRNVLTLAADFPAIKKIVLTSSVAAVHGDAADIASTSGGIFTEEHWNLTSSEKHNPYQYSKTIAEKEAWKIAESQHQWKLAVINPGFVVGPSLSPRVDSTSIDTMRSLLNGKYKSGVPDIWFGLVDVRDVARAHILAAEKEEVTGRHICIAGVMPLTEMAKVLREKYPDRPVPASVVPKFLLYMVGPMMGFSWKYIRLNYGVSFRLDNTRSIRQLGLTYRPLKETFLDHAEQLISAKLV